MTNKTTFTVKVIANNIHWNSLPAKLDAIRDFYAPRCNLVFDVVRTSLEPVFSTYPELGTVAVVDREWYDVNIATPHAIDTDLILLIVSRVDHIGIVTYAGYMSFNNVGPWETTVFAQGEFDDLYMQGKNLGNSFVVYACHELSHAFYYIVGKHDDTHVHFPVAQDPYVDDPKNVLADFDFSTRYAALEWLKDKLIGAATVLGILQKRHIALIGDRHIS